MNRPYITLKARQLTMQMIKKSFALVLQTLRRCKAHAGNLVCEKNTAMKAIYDHFPSVFKHLTVINTW